MFSLKEFYTGPLKITLPGAGIALQQAAIGFDGRVYI